MTAFEQSDRAAHSAKLLFADGDFNGAINRAYYAMLLAARGFLEKRGVDTASVKTHRGAALLFRQQLSRENADDVYVAKLLQRAAETRVAADYDGYAAEMPAAEQVLHDMDVVLARIAALMRLQD